MEMMLTEKLGQYFIYELETIHEQRLQIKIEQMILWIEVYLAETIFTSIFCNAHILNSNH